MSCVNVSALSVCACVFPRARGGPGNMTCPAAQCGRCSPVTCLGRPVHTMYTLSLSLFLSRGAERGLGGPPRRGARRAPRVDEQMDSCKSAPSCRVVYPMY